MEYATTHSVDLSVLSFIDVNAALARWMHRVCADLAGCYENPVSKFAVTYHRTNPPRRGGPLCPPARFGMKMGFIVAVLLFIDVKTALAGWMHRVCADLAGCYENSVWYWLRLGWFVT